MTNFEKYQSLYQTNSEFHKWVDTVIQGIHDLKFSPQEVREAVTFACIKFELERRPNYIKNFLGENE